jgi:hypothetical protein
MSYEVQVSGEGFVIAWDVVGPVGVRTRHTKRQRNLMFLEMVVAGLNNSATPRAYLYTLDFLCRYEDAV